MTDSRNALIKDLAADLRPVALPGDTVRPLAWWLTWAAIYSVTIVLITGGWRAGAFAALFSSPRFVLEVSVAVAAIVCLAHSALRSAIPDDRSAWRQFSLPAALVGGWAILYVIGLWYPALAPSMLGKREHCFWQTLFFGLPSLALLLWFARRLLPLSPRATAAAAGAAAAALPAILMQLACMYDPLHALSHHVLPIAVAAAIGALAGRLCLVRPQTKRLDRRSGTTLH